MKYLPIIIAIAGLVCAFVFAIDSHRQQRRKRDAEQLGVGGRGVRR